MVVPKTTALPLGYTPNKQNYLKKDFLYVSDNFELNADFVIFLLKLNVFKSTFKNSS